MFVAAGGLQQPRPYKVKAGLLSGGGLQQPPLYGGVVPGGGFSPSLSDSTQNVVPHTELVAVSRLRSA